MISLYEFLIQNGFYIDRPTADLLEKIITTSNRKAIMLRGMAGVGKTQLTHLIARYLDTEYVFYQCTYGTDEDMLLYKYVPSEQARSGIKITLGPVPRALMMSQKRKVVLVLDEFDKTRPSADALLLDVLQNYRLSLYLGDNDNETIITGNPDNLIIILTSNDMREFSEPLLRRLVVITLEPLPTTAVYEMLKKQFKENTALLLAQIYDDTLRAGLRKPATIQELVQLGEVLESGVNAQLQDLIRMFIVKYDDDWGKYLQYVSSREPYKFVNGNANSIDVTQYYEPPQEVQMPQPQPQSQSQETQQLLEKISKIVVRQVNNSIINAVKEEISDTIETTFKAALSENDITNYSEIIKTLIPTPSDTPDVFGKFKIIKDTSEYAITSTQPLSITEYINLLRNTSTEFEGYIEDELLIFNPDAINYLIKYANEVRYYTDHTIQVVYKGYVTEAIEVRLLDGKYNPQKINTISKIKVRVYVNAKKRDNYKSLLYNFIMDNVCYAKMKSNVDVNAESLVAFGKELVMLLSGGACDKYDVVIRTPPGFSENDVKKIHELLVKEGVSATLESNAISGIIKYGLIELRYNDYRGAMEITYSW